MSPRDGVQFFSSHSGGANAGGDARLVPLEMKQELIEILQGSGVHLIEVAAFVSKSFVPQMADSDELVQRIKPSDDIRLAALVPNLKHYERFKRTELDTVALFPSASESYARKNFGGKSVDEVLASARDVAKAAREDERRLRAHVSGAFQDIEDYARSSHFPTVRHVCEELFEMGCEYVALADTDGQTHPERVKELIGRLAADLDIDIGRQVGVHLHDRNGWGLANAYAAWEVGVRIFDSSIGGIGGSLSASAVAQQTNTAGNIATEALVEMFERMGVPTGVDQRALIKAGEVILAMTRLTGDFQPPSILLREELGYGGVWERTPSSPMPPELE
jgi:hydroxymethylglutaryl-CoA lyase